MTLHSLITSRVFQVLGVPITFMLIGVFAKRLGRRDGDSAPRRNDWAVATTILLMTLGVITGDLLRVTPGKTADLTAWLVGILLVIFISIDHDRYRSWVSTASTTTDTKRMLMGIVLPDIAAIFVFAAYQYDKLGQP
jgi:hypothetical protein